MKSVQQFAATAAAVVALASHGIDAKAIYAHYMLGGIDGGTDHAQQDIDDAVAMGFDGFAINIGETSADWATNALDQLFAAAEGKEFRLFFSLDTYAEENVGAFASLFHHFDNPAYLRWGSESKPFVSTFWGGRLGQQVWQDLKSNHDMHFVPVFDDLSNYYSDPAGFFADWDSIVDGAFNWETAWPGRSDSPVNVSSSRDEDMHAAASAAGKDFMMPISPLQYKHCCGGNYYRVGEGNLPERMTQILDVKPEIVEFITWNDGGESHYIGNLWEETFSTSPEIVEYANNDDFPHFAWQPLMTSFIQAYKDDVDASQMKPPGNEPIGAIWYHPVLKSCSSDSPEGAGAALDAINYAFVLPSSLEGATIRVTSGGNVLAEVDAVTGLNYGTYGEIQTGSQKVEIVQDGSVVATAASDKEVQGDMNGFCNFNYYVVGLE